MSLNLILGKLHTNLIFNNFELFVTKVYFNVFTTNFSAYFSFILLFSIYYNLYRKAV